MNQRLYQQFVRMIALEIEERDRKLLRTVVSTVLQDVYPKTFKWNDFNTDIKDRIERLNGSETSNASAESNK